MEIEKIVFEALRELIGDDKEIKMDSFFNKDLGIDSIKGFRLMLYLEKKGLVFKNGPIANINQVKDLVSSLEFK